MYDQSKCREYITIVCPALNRTSDTTTIHKTQGQLCNRGRRIARAQIPERLFLYSGFDSSDVPMIFQWHGCPHKTFKGYTLPTCQQGCKRISQSSIHRLSTRGRQCCCGNAFFFFSRMCAPILNMCICIHIHKIIY